MTPLSTITPTITRNPHPRVIHQKFINRLPQIFLQIRQTVHVSINTMYILNRFNNCKRDRNPLRTFVYKVTVSVFFTGHSQSIITDELNDERFSYNFRKRH